MLTGWCDCCHVQWLTYALLLIFLVGAPEHPLDTAARLLPLPPVDVDRVASALKVRFAVLGGQHLNLKAALACIV